MSFVITWWATSNKVYAERKFHVSHSTQYQLRCVLIDFNYGYTHPSISLKPQFSNVLKLILLLDCVFMLSCTSRENVRRENFITDTVAPLSFSFVNCFHLCDMHGSEWKAKNMNGNDEQRCILCWTYFVLMLAFSPSASFVPSISVYSIKFRSTKKT